MNNLNKHINHLEDIVLLNNGKDLYLINEIFKNLLDCIQYYKNPYTDDFKISLKIDGSPAVLIWNSFNELIKPGISTKSLFNKIPVICYNDEDIDKYFGDKIDLCYKLKSLLKLIPCLNIPDNEIWQGDFLFDDKTINVKKIHNKEYYTFKPNTLVYAIEKENRNPHLKKIIGNKKVGVIFHTKYTGTSLNDLNIDSNIDVVNQLSIINELFAIDPYIKSLETNFNENEFKYVFYLMSEIYDYLEYLHESKNYYNIINELSEYFILYNNYLIKNNLNNESFIEEFSLFIKLRFEKQINERKTELSKFKLNKQLEYILNIINENEDLFIFINNTMKSVAKLKEIFIKKLNENVDWCKTFVELENNIYKETEHEGFVININDNLVKLVDRKEFSKLNFSKDVIKGY